MADAVVEAQFLSLFWGLCEKNDPQVDKVLAHIRPEMFEAAHLGKGYEILRKRYAAGKSMFDLPAQQEMMEVLGADYFVLSEDKNNTKGILRGYAGPILLEYRKRKQVEVLEGLVEKAKKATPANAHKIVDAAMDSLMGIHRDESGSAGPQTREEYGKLELSKLDKDRPKSGIILPYSQLAQQVGPLLPGDLVGVSAYSNGGKSLLLANLFRWFVVQGHPCIVFPTEMREKWLSRVFAAHSRVPQMIAERELWDDATQKQKDDYTMAVNDLVGMPNWEVVNRPSISAREIISRATVLRRQYPGRKVIVMVDHMHRLDYGNSKAEFEVGSETRRLRDWAASDPEGGIVLVLLYQPRKPENELELYKPVHGYQIKGVSEVWNEMDIHLSPYRRWVKTVKGWEKNPQLRTAWGTPQCLYQSGNTHIPEFGKPGEADGKLDDQHAYIKIDKRRTGGEGGTVMLDVDYPSGYIFEPNRLQKHTNIRIGGGE
jgi:replicative DNA helicase